jgi:hypothetical protein
MNGVRYTYPKYIKIVKAPTDRSIARDVIKKGIEK